jgi:peroxidase
MRRTWWNPLAAGNSRTSLPRRRLLPTILELEARCLLSGYRTITGYGNNLANPVLGEAGTDLVRIAPAAYADGVSAPSLPNDPGARFISNALNDQTDPNNPSQDLSTVNSKSLSDFSYVWGQFIDHDMDLTASNSGQSFDIPPGSPTDPMGTEPFTRSKLDPATGTGPGNPRQQVNDVTSFLDLSQVYGSDPVRADALRTHAGGRLKTSPGNLLPYNNSTYFTTPLDMANDAQQVPDSQLFAAGDRRANENIELTAIQTLFVREHNRLAAQLQKAHPDWSDVHLYQEARKINIAEEEIITYTEFLPALLGPNSLPAYTGYNPGVNPGIATEFSTALFRFGHSLLSGTVGRDQNNGLGIADVSPAGSGVDLAQDFFDPNLINPKGIVDPVTGHTSSDIGAILKADADNGANEMDLLLIRQVRNLLFGQPGAGGTDLAARDVQRGRDHGLPDYNTIRATYGLPRVTSFAQITSDVAIQQKLQQVYGSVDKIDAFEGALAEDHVAGADVGPLIKAVLADQFRRLRDGDRFFYLNEFHGTELQALLENTSLARVIERNTTITNLQSNVFFFRASISGTVFLDFDGDGGHRTFFEPGLSGLTVQLKDAGGNVLATTVTDDEGHYSFSDQSGLAGTGKYTVSLVLPAGAHRTTADPGALLISRGGINLTGVDFGIEF